LIQEGIGRRFAERLHDELGLDTLAALISIGRPVPAGAFWLSFERSLSVS